MSRLGALAKHGLQDALVPGYFLGRKTFAEDIRRQSHATRKATASWVVLLKMDANVIFDLPVGRKALRTPNEFFKLSAGCRASSQSDERDCVSKGICASWVPIANVEPVTPFPSHQPFN